MKSPDETPKGREKKKKEKKKKHRHHDLALIFPQQSFKAGGGNQSLGHGQVFGKVATVIGCVQPWGRIKPPIHRVNENEIVPRLGRLEASS